MLDMSPLGVGALLSIAISLSFYLGISVRDYRLSQGLGDYFFYDWALGNRSIAATIFASGMSLATVVIALLDLGRVFGTAVIWAPITYCLGWFTLVLAAPAIRSNTTLHDTIHTFLGKSYESRSLLLVSSWATIVGFVGTFATEIIAGDVIFSSIGLGKYGSTIGIAVFALITVIYSGVGGFRSVIRSDSIQAWLLIPSLAGIVALAFNLFSSVTYKPFWSSKLLTTFTLPFSVIISLALINIAFPIADMSAWQRVRAADSDSSFQVGGIVAIVGFAVTWTLLIVLGAGMGPSISSENSPFIQLVTEGRFNSSLSNLILGIVLFPGLVAAMLSTADTFLNAAGHTYSLDIKKEQERNSNDGQSRATRDIIIMGIAGFLGALVFRELGFSIVDMIFAVYGGTLSLCAPVIYALYFNEDSSAHIYSLYALLSVIAGFLASWSNGIYSIVCRSSYYEACGYIQSIWSPDIFMSPVLAFSISTVIFVIPVLVKSLKSHEKK